MEREEGGEGEGEGRRKRGRWEEKQRRKEIRKVRRGKTEKEKGRDRKADIAGALEKGESVRERKKGREKAQGKKKGG